MEWLADRAVNVFTDGSSLQNPRRGGYGFLFVTVDEDGQEVVQPFSPDGAMGANNQEMELKACVEALKLLGGPRSPVDLGRFSRIVIYTDSLYLQKHFGTAKFQWSSNRYTRRGGAPVLHAHLWKELVKAARNCGLPVDIEWIKGKSNPYAKRVDTLAKDSAERPFGRAPTVRSVRRKHSARSVEVGSVGVEGQELEIQIVAAEWLGEQRCYRYKYEVMNPDSLYFGSVDFVFSDQALRHRFVYRVRLNEDADHPQIAEILDEVGAAVRTSAGRS